MTGQLDIFALKGAVVTAHVYTAMSCPNGLKEECHLHP
jgi:hypothetical protein